MKKKQTYSEKQTINKLRISCDNEKRHFLLLTDRTVISGSVYVTYKANADMPYKKVLQGRVKKMCSKQIELLLK